MKSANRPARNALRVLTTCTLALLAACTEPRVRTDAPGLRVGDVLGGDNAGTGFARADAPREFQFPADHGAHPDFRSEWWYLTLVLADADGREFGVQFTVFRQASFPGAAADDPWRNGQSFLGHFAVTDVAANRHRQAERLSRGHPALAFVRALDLRNPPESGGGPDSAASVVTNLIDPAAGESTASTPINSAGGFVVWLEGWQLSAIGDHWRLVAEADDIAATIDLRPTKPIILQGDGGLSAKGPGQASYYYSVPRLRAAGSLRIDDAIHAVQGNGWLDREWSTSVLGPHQVGWDWFALMLDSGEDIMAFRLRRDDGTRDPYDQGVLVDVDGRARHLDVDDFNLQSLEFWRDEHGTAWPIRWALRLDARQWEIAAPVKNQRMDTLLTYWEGLVQVRNQRGEPVGRGYMELTGYR